MTVGVVIFSLLLGSAAILMPSKSLRSAKDLRQSSKGKVKYVSQKKSTKSEKKAHFLDQENASADSEDRRWELMIINKQLNINEMLLK